MGLFDYATGEMLSKMKPHTNEISNIKIDYINKLIITSSTDASLFIHKEL